MYIGLTLQRPVMVALCFARSSKSSVQACLRGTTDGITSVIDQFDRVFSLPLFGVQKFKCPVSNFQYIIDGVRY